MARKKIYNYPLVVDGERVNIRAFKKLAKLNGRSFNAEVNEAMVNHLKPQRVQLITKHDIQ